MTTAPPESVSGTAPKPEPEKQPKLSSPMSWWASQAMEFDLPLPAECWMR